MNANNSSSMTADMVAEQAARDQKAAELRDATISGILRFTAKAKKNAVEIFFRVGSTLTDKGKEKAVEVSVTLKNPTGQSRTELLAQLYGLGAKILPVNCPKVSVDGDFAVKFSPEMEARDIALAMGYEPPTK